MILCCGEALIDMIPGQTADGTPAMVPTPGGAVFNTSIGLGRLGADVALLTGVSDDLFGRQLRGALESSNVSQTHLVTCDAPTSLAFVELNDGQASYTFYTRGAADTQVQAADCPSDVSACSALFFGGISLCTDPTASSMADLMSRATQAGVPTMVDPNIRASFIRDEVNYRARLNAMLAQASIVKVSDEDLAWIANGPTKLGTQISALGLRSDAILLLSFGADGSVAYRDGAQIAQAAAEQVQVADTVGAGDTFNAGFLFALQQMGKLKTAAGEPTAGQVQTALQFGNACAAVTVSRKGANPPRLEELDGAIRSLLNAAS